MTQPMVEAGRKTGTSKPPTAGFRFKRAIFPFGGLRMVEAGLKAAGFEADPQIQEAFTKYCKRHRRVSRGRPAGNGCSAPPRRWRTASQSAAARRWRLIFSRAQRRKSGSATGWGRRWATQRRIKCASPICCATPDTQLTPGINCLRRASSFSWGGRSSSAAGARVWRTARF